MKDVVIVLSHRLRKGKPSPEFMRRLDKGIEEVLVHDAKNLMLCSETANEEMKRYAIRKGVTKGRVLLEDESKDTIGEAFFSKKLCLKNDWRDITVVSSDYHIKYRAALIFDFVFGEDYNLSYIGVNSGKVGNNRILDQMKSLGIFLDLIKGVNPGDDHMIEQVLRIRHRLYKG